VRKAVDLVVIHSTECECRRGKAKAVSEYFKRLKNGVSAHYIVDPGEVVAHVPEERIAWHAPGANARSIGVELCGYAAQTWTDPLAEEMLERAVELVAGICDRWNIPKVWITDLHQRGITGHRECTDFYCSGRGHQDPGPNFDRQGFAAAVANYIHLAQRTP
jgi:N-acetyl-anhydromuramyl-L-alanine amidase AmpD